MNRLLRLSLAAAALLGGCASAGGTAGIFDTGRSDARMSPLDLLGAFGAAAVISFLLMRSSQWVLGRMRVERKAAILLSAIPVLVVAFTTVGSYVAVMAYTPALALWLVVDLSRIRKKAG